MEQLGLAHDIGMWTLNVACREARSWQADGLVGLRVAVNVPPSLITDPGFPARMAEVLSAQQGLYTLVVKHADGSRDRRVIGSMVDYLHAPADPEAVLVPHRARLRAQRVGTFDQVNRLTIYKALGGGWREAAADVPAVQ